jgi:hypothetical protein
VTFTANVASATAGSVPAGNVTFRDGLTELATETLDATGAAAFETAALSGGSHTISVTYDGDASRGTSSVASVTQTVAPAPVSVAVTPSANPSVFGQSVTLTAQVTAMPTGDFAGVVTFFDGAAAIGAVAMEASGTATVGTSSLSVGTHSITALYGGDSDHAGATSAALSEAVAPIRTTTSIAASSNPARVGAALTFAATVAAVAPGSGVPKGTVTFSDAAGALGEATLDANGVATLAVATLAAGIHPVTASYGGTPDFAPSIAEPLMELIAVNSTTVAVTSSPNPSTYGASVMVVATVTGSVTTATGKVTFRAGAKVLGDAALDATGTAAFATTTLPVGALTLSAAYAGDAANAPGSGTVTQVVNGPATAMPPDAGAPDAGVTSLPADASFVTWTPTLPQPPPQAASIGGANCGGCRVANPRRERPAGFVALTMIAALVLRRRLRRS